MQRAAALGGTGCMATVLGATAGLGLLGGPQPQSQP